jgi:hypothetical protein
VTFRATVAVTCESGQFAGTTVHRTHGESLASGQPALELRSAKAASRFENSEWVRTATGATVARQIRLSLRTQLVAQAAQFTQGTPDPFQLLRGHARR